MFPLWFRGTITLDTDVLLRWQLFFDPRDINSADSVWVYFQTFLCVWLAVLTSKKAGRDLNPEDFQ